jgi:ParB-like chromosome segregation protein Spo0J
MLANPKNWRIHPRYQREALAGVLDEVGWVQEVIVNQRTNTLIDGHLRVDLAVERNEGMVPVIYVDLSDDEESLILATLDPLAGMAVADKAQLEELMSQVATNDARVQQILREMAEREGLAKSEPYKQPKLKCPECGHEFERGESAR